MTERMRSNDDSCECGHSYAWHYNCDPGHYTGSYAAGACGACDCASFWDAAPWTPKARGLLVTAVCVAVVLVAAALMRFMGWLL